MSLTFKTEYTQIAWSVYLTVSHIIGQSKMSERSPESMLEETKDIKGVIRTHLLKKNNTMAKRKVQTDKQRSTKHTLA